MDKKLAMTLVVWSFSLFLLVVFVATTPTAFGSEQQEVTTTGTAAECNPATDLSGHINGATGTVYNKSTNPDCVYKVGMASYKIYSPNIDDQELYSSATAMAAPGKQTVLSVGLPNCMAQVDLFWGDVITGFKGQRYGDRKLDYTDTAGNVCTATSPTATTGTSAPGTTGGTTAPTSGTTPGVTQGTTGPGSTTVGGTPTGTTTSPGTIGGGTTVPTSSTTASGETTVASTTTSGTTLVGTTVSGGTTVAATPPGTTSTAGTGTTSPSNGGTTTASGGTGTTPPANTGTTVASGSTTSAVGTTAAAGGGATNAPATSGLTSPGAVSTTPGAGVPSGGVAGTTAAAGAGGNNNSSAGAGGITGVVLGESATPDVPNSMPYTGSGEQEQGFPVFLLPLAVTLLAFGGIAGLLALNGAKKARR